MATATPIVYSWDGSNNWYFAALYFFQDNKTYDATQLGIWSGGVIYPPKKTF